MAIQLMLSEVQRQQREEEERLVRLRERPSRPATTTYLPAYYANVAVANFDPYQLMPNIQLPKKELPWYEDLDRVREEIWKSHVEPVIRQLPHLIKADAR